MKTFITRYPVAAFIGITFFMSHLFTLLLYIFFGHKAGFLNDITQIVGSYGPALSALIVTGFTLGSAGVIQLIEKLKPIGKHLLWYILLPLAGMAITSLAFIAGDIPTGKIIMIIGQNPAPLALSFLALTLKVGIGEELGWRGWLLPKLMANQNPIKATLWVAVIWAVWHIQFFLNTWQILIPFLVFIFSVAIILTWLWHKVHGDILLIAIAHASVDSEFFIERQVHTLGYGNHVTISWAILSMIYAAIAIALYLSNRKWWHTAPRL